MSVAQAGAIRHGGLEAHSVLRLMRLGSEPRETTNTTVIR